MAITTPNLSHTIDLAPESKAFIALVSKNHPEKPPTNEEMRRGLEALVALYGGAPQKLPLIKEHLIESAPDHNKIAVRVYYPKTDEKLPVMLYIHGGGWTRGNLNTHDKLCRNIAARAKVAVASVEYRLSPEHPFPAGLHDSLSAYNWVRANAKMLNIDPERIVIAGDSGGGNLAASLTCTLKSKGQPMPKMLMLFYPSLDLTGGSRSMEEFSKGAFLTKDSVEHYVHNYIGNAKHHVGENLETEWQVSPLFFDDFHDFPKTSVLVCGCDPIRDDGIRFFNKIPKESEGSLIVMDGTLHAFLQFYDCFARQNEKALDWVAENVKQHL